MAGFTKYKEGKLKENEKIGVVDDLIEAIKKVGQMVQSKPAGPAPEIMASNEAGNLSKAIDDYKADLAVAESAEERQAIKEKISVLADGRF